MNFDEAIGAHSTWKTKLSKYLQKPDGSLHAADIGPDDKCELGKWIAAEGNKLSKLPEFRSLKQEHTRFHKAAADVVRRADAGENVKDDVVLGAHSEFGGASSAVVQALMHMKNHV